MYTFTALVLICSSTILPENCTLSNAFDFISSSQQNELACLQKIIEDQNHLIQNNFVPEGYYPLARCERNKK